MKTKHPFRYVALTLVSLMISSAQAGPGEDKALFDAIQRNDPSAVQQALKQGANPAARSFRGTAMDLARKSGNPKIMELLSAQGTPPQSAPEVKTNPQDSAQPVQAPPTTADTQAEVEPEALRPDNLTETSPADASATAQDALPSPVPPSGTEQESVAATQPPASPETIANAVRIIESGDLKKTYNPIVVDYLVHEGKDRLSPELTRSALDQLVAALLAKTQISKEEQLEMSLGVLTGIAMGTAGNDVISDAGGSVENSYAAEWNDWITSAFNLIHAGYSEDAAAFFEFGMVHIPYPALQARCVKGMALARPEQAYDFLMEKLKTDNSPDVKAHALPLLGLLASDQHCTPEQKEAIFQMLTDNTGMMGGPEGQLGAMRGFENMNDPRAAEAMRPFTTGLTTDKYVKRAAIRGLLFTYGDRDMIPLLAKMANAGTFSMTDDYDKVWAGLLLIEAQAPEGYAWAAAKLPPPRRNFFAPKDTGPDPRGDIVHYLVKYGGEKGHQVLSECIGKYKDDDWMKTWIATGLLEFHDTSHIALVKASLNNPEWDFTAVRIVEALAKNGDYSGLAVLDQLIHKTPPKKNGATLFMNALAGKADDTAEQERRLANLRIQVAEALARINTPACVPLLTALLNDRDIYVRSAAALGLTEMTIPDALDGLKAAMTVDYGMAQGASRTPNLQAHVIRLACMRYPGDPRTNEICRMGRTSPSTAVRFLATAES